MHKNQKSWKVIQSGIKKRKKNRLALVAILIILLTLLTGNSIRFLGNLFKPYTDSFPEKSYSFDGSSNFYLAVRNGDNVSLLIFDPNEKRVADLEIPPETFIKASGELGFWQARSIYELGGSSGSKLLKNSLSSFFGLPVEGYLELESSESTIGILKNIRTNPFSWFLLKNKLKTDLTTLELIKIYAFLLQVRSDKFISYNTFELDLMETSNLPDGSKIYLPGVNLDKFITENLFDQKIKNEQITIAVLNGTSKGGFAKEVSRIISNMGGNVIITDTMQNSEHSAVYGVESHTKKRLSRIFGSEYAILKEAPASRAQVIVVLGEDLSQ